MVLHPPFFRASPLRSSCYSSCTAKDALGKLVAPRVPPPNHPCPNSRPPTPIHNQFLSSFKRKLLRAKLIFVLTASPTRRRGPVLPSRFFFPHQPQDASLKHGHYLIAAQSSLQTPPPHANAIYSEAGGSHSGFVCRSALFLCLLHTHVPSASKGLTPWHRQLRVKSPVPIIGAPNENRT